MRIARRFAVALTALSVCLVASESQAVQFQQSDVADVPNAIVLTYDPVSGNVSANGNGTVFSSFEIKSAGGMLIPASANDGVASGPFDVNNSGKFFKLATDGMTDLDIGPIVPAGMSADAFIAEMAVDGSIKPSGKLVDATGGGPFLYVVPEPSSLVLVFFGLLGLLGLRRK